MTGSLPEDPGTPDAVRGLDGWAVGRSGGEDFAVSRRCRHNLADLGGGTVDADGCLVCPWHGARYDVGTGRMVDGPQGLLGYHGHIPFYDTVIRLLVRLVPLRVGRVLRGGGRITVR